MSENLKIYEKSRAVPKEAQKPIKGGRLSGMTDINPMWRIKTLTELFGPCGIGWWYEIKDKRLEKDDETQQVAAFVDINLFYILDGKVSMPIPGTGGSMFVSKESKGFYDDDECYKKALTDAIGVAAKALGVGANIYWDKDRSKYAPNESATETPEKAPAEVRDTPKCGKCGKEVKPYVSVKTGMEVTAEQHAAITFARYKLVMCRECAVEHEKKLKTVEDYGRKLSEGE